MAVRGSSVPMPSGHMMSRGQALLAGLSGSWSFFAETFRHRLRHVPWR